MRAPTLPCGPRGAKTCRVPRRGLPGSCVDLPALTSHVAASRKDSTTLGAAQTGGEGGVKPAVGAAPPGGSQAASYLLVCRRPGHWTSALSAHHPAPFTSPGEPPGCHRSRPEETPWGEPSDAPGVALSPGLPWTWEWGLEAHRPVSSSPAPRGRRRHFPHTSGPCASHTHLRCGAPVRPSSWCKAPSLGPCFPVLSAPPGRSQVPGQATRHV